MLLVSAGVVCRTVTAETLLRHRLAELGSDAVVNAVDLGGAGLRPCPRVVKVLRRRGFRVRGYRSRAPTPDLLSNADLVLVMSTADREQVVGEGPAAPRNVFTLKELIRQVENLGGPRPEEAFDAWLARLDAGRTVADLATPSVRDDIADPAGGSPAAFERMADEVQALTGRLASLLVGTDVARHGSPLVVQVVPYYPPHVGGMENVARVVAEQLAEEGPVEVLTSRQSDPVPQPRVERRGQLTVRRLATREIAGVPFMPTMLFHLLRLPPDALVHLHIAQAFVPETVWLAARLRRRPYIAHFHLDVEPSGRFGPVFVAYKRWILGGVLRSASTVIVVSPDQTAFLTATHRVPADRIRLIPNGVGPEFARGPRPAPDHGGPFRMLFVGRLAPQKNVSRLLRAVAAAASPIELVIVGDGAERPMLERLVADLALEGVRFVGAQSGQKLVDWYLWADAFILTSDKESTGLVLLEAMASGLPVIANDVPGIHDTVADDGILAPADPTELAHAIDRLVADPVLWEDLSRRGSERAGRLPWTVLFDSLRDLYRETTLTLP